MRRCIYDPRPLRCVALYGTCGSPHRQLRTRAHWLRPVRASQRTRRGLRGSLEFAPAPQHLVQHDGGAASHVERVLDAEDRDLEHGVALIEHGLIDAGHLVAQYDRDAPRLVAQLRRCAERQRIVGRLERDDVEAAGA